MRSIAVQAFASAMSGFMQQPVSTLGLCVSGGPDSSALFWLAQEWAASQREHAPKLFVVHVDHALRATSAQEAEDVQRMASGAGIHCIVKRLSWDSDVRISKTHEALRHRRYACLAEAADEMNASFLASAHHRDDVIETFVQRVHMASGIAGLAHPIGAVSYPWPGRALAMIRPLLSLQKKQLAACLPDHVQCVDDPLNRSPRYLRSRVRMALDGDEELREDLSRLCDWVGEEWSHVEKSSATLENMCVCTKGDCSLISAALISVLRSKQPVNEIAARALVRKCLGRAKGTTRLRDSIVHHLLAWMTSPSTLDKGVSRWSEAGVVVTWRRRGQQFEVAPMHPIRVT